ncbi:MAG: acyl-CoA/acyl-ACP dehydrogenase, partial [Candidatus Nanopelagicales bacterium]|nr:acyl-CoA/acyl-ACP dehydrogenase [Candidatus Nanopelagicales bacterium]
MNFDLPAQNQSLQAEADSVATRVEPMAIEADAMSAPHPGVRQALADSRLWELLVPSEYGGRFPQVDPLAVAVVREVLMATSSHLDSLFALQGIGSYAVSIGGSEEQRQNWLPRVASGETLAALGLTESMAGSDLKSLKTVVLDDADGGGLILNGEKAFISNGGVAGFYTVLAKDGDGFSMLLVPAEVAGLTTKLTPEIIAPHILADLQFEGVRLPRTSILGLRGQGFDLVLAT